MLSGNHMPDRVAPKKYRVKVGKFRCDPRNFPRLTKPTPQTDNIIPMQRNIDSTNVIWAGIHYLLYLRPSHATDDGVRLSLFETEYSAHGGGNAAFLFCTPSIQIDGFANGIYTDNPALGEWLFSYMYRGRDNPLAAAGDNLVITRFTRSGDLRRAVTIHMETNAGVMQADWQDLDPPFVHHGPGAIGSVYTYCIFVTAPTAQLRVAGETMPGTIYPREDWQRLVGRPLSSSLLGWEMWTDNASDNTDT